MIYDINYTAQQLEDEFYNDLIKSFVEIVTREFERKRSSDLYEISYEFKDYAESVSEFDIFPKELVQRMQKVMNGDPIEDIVYDLDKIQKKFIRA